MNYQEVNQDQFDSVIEKIGAECTGHDAGRTHSIESFTREGKHVGTRFSCKESIARVWTYELASFLCEAYLK